MYALLRQLSDMDKNCIVQTDLYEKYTIFAQVMSSVTLVY
jgi:hypothetical protein